MAQRSTAAISPDKRYAALEAQGTLYVAGISSGRIIKKIETHDGVVWAIAFSSDGKYILTGGGASNINQNNTVKLWDVRYGRQVRAFKGYKEGFESHITSVAFSPDGKQAAAGSYDGTVKLWDISSGEATKTFRATMPYLLKSGSNSGGVSSVAFSPDGKYIASGSEDGTTRLWDISTGRKIRTLAGHTSSVSSVAFSPDGKYIASGSYDKTIRLWEACTGKGIRIFAGNVSTPGAVTFSPDGRYFLAGGKDIKLWDTKTGREIKRFKQEAKKPLFSPDGKYILSGNKDMVILWDVETGRKIRTLYHPVKRWGGYVTFSSKGRHIITGGDTGIKIWDIATGSEIKFLKRQLGIPAGFVFSTDGRYALTNEYYRGFKPILWDIYKGEIRSFKGNSSGVLGKTFSSDGRYVLAQHGANGRISLWDVSTGREATIIKKGDGSIALRCATFSPDGKQVFTSSDFAGIEQNLTLRNVSRLKEIRTFRGHSAHIDSIAISPDKKYVVSSSQDGTSRLWNINTGKEIAKFISFTGGEWIAITPEGYYNSSLNGHKHLNVRTDNKVYGIDQFYDVFYRLDIVTARLRGEDISSLVTLTIDDAIKNPPPTVKFTSIPSASDKARVKVC